jgi:hypothetical protein
VDTRVFHGGHAAIRLEHFANDPNGHGRVHQRVAVLPHRCYRVSIWARARELMPARVTLLVLRPGEDERPLAGHDYEPPSTGTWKRFTFLFNSMDLEAVELYAGVWEGKGGTLWLDDWTIEEVGPVNVLRRPGTPVSVRGEDGTVYEEGRDFARLDDPGVHDWNDDHSARPLVLRQGGRILPGTRLKVNWYHPMIIGNGQVTVCMAEPEIYAIAAKTATLLVETLHPKRVMLSMDEIRMGGTCEACRGRNMGELLGEAITKLAGLLHAADPAITVYAWSDMLDPNVNAHGNYYLVEGDFTGSWGHVPKDLVIAVWGQVANEESFRFFSYHDFDILGACYYDAGNLDQVKPWMDMARKYSNVRGLMYTTWDGKYRLLPAFGDLLGAGR